MVKQSDAEVWFSNSQHYGSRRGRRLRISWRLKFAQNMEKDCPRLRESSSHGNAELSGKVDG